MCLYTITLHLPSASVVRAHRHQEAENRGYEIIMCSNIEVIFITMAHCVHTSTLSSNGDLGY